MLAHKAFLLALVICLGAYATDAQSPSSSSTPTYSPSPTPTIDDDGYSGWGHMAPAYFGLGRRTAAETQLGWGILVFGLLIVGLEVLVMLKLKKGWGTDSIRVVGLTLVLTSGLFLIVTGYSQEQIAPMIGLLGTITGFLLGKTSPGKSE